MKKKITSSSITCTQVRCSSALLFVLVRYNIYTIHLHVYHITHLYTSLYFYNPNFNAILFCPHKNQCSLKIASEHAKHMPLLFIHSHHVILFELITEIRSQMIMIFLYLFFFLQKYPNLFLSGLTFYQGVQSRQIYTFKFNTLILSTLCC